MIIIYSMSDSAVSSSRFSLSSTHIVTKYRSPFFRGRIENFDERTKIEKRYEFSALFVLIIISIWRV